MERMESAMQDQIDAWNHAHAAMEKISDEIVREVAELPDRTSPDHAPDMMLVSAEELRAIVLAALKQS